jgi:hypothetical protein
MWRLVKYLEENWPAMEAGGYDGLAEKLAEIWPPDGGATKDHQVLAAAVAAAFRLGRRAQEIKEAGDREAEKFFRESILVAFETGRRSAITSP